MKYYFKTELKRALLGRNAIISFFITVGILIASFMNYIGMTNPNLKLVKYFLENPNADAIDAFITIMSSSIVIVFPLLSTIIFADSYLIDKESGFIKFIYTRLSIKKYVLVKVIVNSISSALIAIISSLLTLIFLIIIFGIKNQSITSYTSNILGPFNFLLVSSNTRLIYALIRILSFSIGYIVMSTLALGLSAWIKNKYLVLIFPLFYFIFCGTVLDILGINSVFDFHLARVLSLKYSMTTPIHLFIYPLLLLIIGITLFYSGVIIKNEKDL
ncbi:TPA: hypothetical protein ACF2DS_001847 [Clostridium perfringens]|uniref:hypothetical protein n=1 Tax=Clostridium perfringens TaxID=1502 RepID=UPI000F5488AF|nr:hypothetical protein [Clostridium perfringens]EJT6341859.1 hypothetical protein [Clostridium perfringens]ELQ0172260.1 hypothetical protein [Clostridium perfringens]MDU1966667.1 hypothetical protein [Clostridium perfringens]MDU7726144.1 hypothetical protein [Clostridium perfringens]UBK98012.1 hypothetical protein KLF26_01980 [Clostridium perfringens]